MSAAATEWPGPGWKMAVDWPSAVSEELQADLNAMRLAYFEATGTAEDAWQDDDVYWASLVFALPLIGISYQWVPA